MESAGLGAPTFSALLWKKWGGGAAGGMAGLLMKKIASGDPEMLTPLREAQMAPTPVSIAPTTRMESEGLQGYVTYKRTGKARPTSPRFSTP